MKKHPITEKWEKTRLLEGLSGVQMDECALKLEEATEFILSINEDVAKSVAGLLLPIVRRCYGENPHKLMEEDLKQMLHKMTAAIVVEQQTMKTIFEGDYEADFVEGLCEGWKQSR